MVSQLYRRDSGSDGRMITIVAIVAVVVLISVLTFSYCVLRRFRAKNSSAPKFIPGKFLKRKWEQWQPQGKYKTVHSSERSENQSLATTNTAYHGGHEERAAETAVAAGVDRNTSVRSVMTLPPYSQAPKETEQVIGREGERGGMDTVVEFPETAEQEETTREEEMESLYQIRQARRREIAEREERRRQRREARDRGDWARLEELRRESRLRANSDRNGSSGNITADTLIAEHQSRPRDRRVSSVAYADVGQVRHDGTRVRERSMEDERGGLLDGAAPMGEHHRNNSEVNSVFTMSNLSRPSIPYSRHRSDSGARSVSTTTSSFDNNQATPVTTDEAPRPSSGSDEQTPISNSSSGNNRDTPESTEENPEDRVDPRIVSMIRDSDNDIIRPPQYETHEWGDAPSYEEAVRRAESRRLQQRQQQQQRQSSTTESQSPLAVPSISVQPASEPNTPVIGGRDSEDHGSR